MPEGDTSSIFSHLVLDRIALFTSSSDLVGLRGASVLDEKLEGSWTH